MRRLPRATALTAMVAAMAAGPTGCKEKQSKKKVEPAPALVAPSGSPPPPPTDPTARKPAVRSSLAPPPSRVLPTQKPPAEVDPGKRPAKVTDAQVALAEQIVATATEFANLMDAAKADCRKAVGVINMRGDDFKETMNQVNALRKQLNNDQKAMAWFSRAYGPKMRLAFAKLGEAISECHSYEDFEVAFRSLGIGAPPPGNPHAPSPHTPAPPSKTRPSASPSAPPAAPAPAPSPPKTDK
jgi:hypothetical protein